MAGRRRAVTISSDDELPRANRVGNYLNEDLVLKPASKDVHPDDWPIFVLSDAVVLSKNGKTLANLLQAELEGPFTVRGRLEVDKEFRHLCLSRDWKARQVDVQDVKGFSMGTGPITIWASGKAGWFEIRPALSYKNIYNKMAEGVALYYFVTDLYEGLKSSKNGKGAAKTLSVDQIFEKYSQSHNPSLTTDQVTQQFQDHVLFLLSQMRKLGEPVTWTSTTFYRWLVKTFPDALERFTRTPARDDALIPTSNTGTAKQKVDKSPNAALGAEKVRKRHRTTTPALISQFMDELHQSKRLRRQNMSIRRLSRALLEEYDIPSDHMAQEIIRAHAKPLLASMGDVWSVSPIYKTLEEILNRPKRPRSDLQKEAADFELKPRSKAPEDESSGVSIVGTVLAARPRHSSPTRAVETVKNLDSDSTHRELGSKLSQNIKKQRGRPSASDTVAPHSETRPSSNSHETKSGPPKTEDDEVLLQDFKSPPRRRGRSRAGKVASLRLAGTVLPVRDTPSTSDAETSDGPSRKRRKVSRSPSETEDPDADNDANQSDYYLANDVPENVKEEETVGKEFQYQLVAEPLLSASPQGPGGLWTCHREECDYVVERADEQDGRAKVHAHFLEHADEIAARENLVLNEKRPHLPISNLLEKLRGLGEAARLAEERQIAGRVVPQPIKRRMVV